MTDLSPAVDAAARALFDCHQAGRMDAGRFDDDGVPWQWEHLTPVDQQAYQEFVQPLVTAAAGPLRKTLAAELDAEEISLRPAQRDERGTFSHPHQAGLLRARTIIRGDR